jgi:hypothetical protein
MASPSQRSVRVLLDLLRGTDGLKVSVAQMWDGPAQEGEEWDAHGARTEQAAGELIERAGRPTYPAYEVYVERVRNEMKEKFRRFSGVVQAVVEVRMSQDRIDGLTEQTQFFADAVADVIERKRGCVGEGIYLPGTYEIVFEGVKRGGLNFSQTAKVKCELEVNRS